MKKICLFLLCIIASSMIPFQRRSQPLVDALAALTSSFQKLNYVLNQKSVVSIDSQKQIDFSGPQSKKFSNLALTEGEKQEHLSAWQEQREMRRKRRQSQEQMRWGIGWQRQPVEQPEGQTNVTEKVKLEAEKEAKRKQEEERKKQEEETRRQEQQRLEAEQNRQQELKKQEQERKKQEEEALKLKQEEEQKRLAEEEKRKKQEEALKLKQEEETRRQEQQRLEAEQNRQQELKKQEQERKKQEEEALKLKQEEEQKRLAEEEKRKKQEEALKLKQEEETRRQEQQRLEAEQNRQQELKKQEQERKKQEEEALKLKQEEEQKRLAEEEKRKKQEEALKLKQEEETRRQEQQRLEAEQNRQQELKKQEQERKKQEEEQKLKAEKKKKETDAIKKIVDNLKTGKDFIEKIKKDLSKSFTASDDVSGYSFINNFFKAKPNSGSLLWFTALLDRVNDATKTGNYRFIHTNVENAIYKLGGFQVSDDGNPLPKDTDGNYTIDAAKKMIKGLAKNNVALYKIHLMPKTKEDLYYALYGILKSNTLPELAWNGKVKFDLPYDQKNIATALTQKNEIFPVIVLYFNSKENAQKGLNELYLMQTESDMEGLNISPRYNKKITDLIYYAQGNGDDKKHNAYVNFFETAKDMVHYKANAFEGAEVVAEEYKDGTTSFYLDDPSQKSKK